MKLSQTFFLCRCLMLIALGTAFALTSLVAQPVDNERSQANPTTNYRWFHNKSEATVNSYVADGYRLIDIQVISTSPYRFTGSMVRNTGVHSKQWGWWYGLTSAQVEDTADKYNFRAIDMEVYRVNNQKRIAVVYVKNTGDQAVNWWYYTDRSLGYLMNKAAENGARIVDLDTYRVGSTRYYSAIMIRNAGKNYKGWWVYNSKTTGEILNLANQHNAQVTDISRISSNNYLALMEKSSDPNFNEQFVIWRNERTENVTEVARHYGARIVDIEPYTVNGQRRFALVMLDNVNPLTTRIGNMLRRNTDGTIAPYSDDRNERGYTVGCRLEEVGGSTLASLQSDRKIYPASTNKVFEYWYIYRTLLQNDPDPANTLNNTFWFRCRQGNINCSDNSNLSQGCDSVVSMRNLLRRMMFNSDNIATNAIQDFAGNGDPEQGRVLMNTWARAILGTSFDTELKHKFACGNVTNDEPNIMTLRDVNRLYEKVFSDPNALDPSLQNLFIQNMLNTNNGFFINQVTDVILDEGAKLGLTASEIADFRNGVRLVHKNGNIGTAYTSAAGWVELPYYCGLGQKQFVFSAFWERASTIDKQNTGSDLNIRVVTAELLREEIRKAMASCRTFDLVINKGTKEPMPGLTVELQMMDPASGRFSTVPASRAFIFPAQNPMTSSRTGNFGWQIQQPGTYRYQISGPDIQTTSTTIWDDSFKIKPPDTVEVESACPPDLAVTTCPDQYIAPHYPGRQIARISATARGGQMPYRFTWSTGTEGEETFVDPIDDKCGPWCDSLPPEKYPVVPGPTRYTVTVTDANGCQATAVHTVHVVDISCASPNGRPAVEMCRPLGRGTRTVCVNLDSVPRRLEMGWSLGNCRDGYDFSGGSCGNPQTVAPDPTTGRREADIVETVGELQVYPNPFTQRTNVVFTAPQPMRFGVEVYSLTGKRIQTLLEPALRDAGTYEVSLEGQHLAEGMYLIVLRGDNGFIRRAKVVKR